jgi:hypothetical protein
VGSAAPVRRPWFGLVAATAGPFGCVVDFSRFLRVSVIRAGVSLSLTMRRKKYTSCRESPLLVSQFLKIFKTMQIYCPMILLQ